MDVDDAVLALKFNPQTTQLDLSDSGTGDADLPRLAGAMRGNQHLETVLLSRNGLTDLAPLLDVVESMPRLAALSVSRNKVTCDGLRGFPAVSMGQLTTLDLSRNDVADAGACAVAAFLGGAPALRVLKLRDNRIGAKGAAALAGAVGRPGAALRELDLGANRLEDEGAEAASFMLTAGCALERLWLDMNAIGAVGGLAIAAALGGGSRLAFLSIVDNRLGDAGVRAIEQAMAGGGGALAEVRLRGNGTTHSHTAI